MRALNAIEFFRGTLDPNEGEFMAKIRKLQPDPLRFIEVPLLWELPEEPEVDEEDEDENTRLRMTKKNRISIVATSLVLISVAILGGEQTMAKTVIYRAALSGEKGRAVIVQREGNRLTIGLEGFGVPVVVMANGGGASTCRTIIEHNSAEVGMIQLSLAMPDTRARCRMLPSFISVESRKFGISLDEVTLKKVTGTDSRIRRTVQNLVVIKHADGV